MGLAIETSPMLSGGNAFYKAICHPVGAVAIQDLIAELTKDGPIAVYDPLGFRPVSMRDPSATKFTDHRYAAQDIKDIAAFWARSPSP
ncbi:MAG: hypothetical protein R3E60_04130 [Alphaproteobacteria bacterium]